MGLSIITPHYNDFEGVKKTHQCLLQQGSKDWQWIIIDDCSNPETKKLLQDFITEIETSKVKIIFNTVKTNASVCRNIGVENAIYSNLVFLDADDFISEDFVSNRDIKFNEFAVFKNTNVINEKGENVETSGSNVDADYLDHFLKANFIWPITAVLWDKTFLIKIGKFDINLKRLQDIELSIRALFLGKNYSIINNKVDFFYCTKPIRLKTNIVNNSCESVNYLISNIKINYSLTTYRHSLIKSYYYACVKNLPRINNRADVTPVKKSLEVFYKTNYVNTFEYAIGYILLLLYKYHLVSNSLFLKVNRYFFKEE